MGKKYDGLSFSQGGGFLAEEDLFGGFARVKGTSLFLGKYSLAEVGAVMGKRGFFKEARKRGLWPLAFEMDSSEFPAQRFQIFYQDKKPEHRIVDLKIKEATFHLKNSLIYGILRQEYRVLHFEWLTLQNPLQHFTPQHPPLPGQAAPGLSLSKKVMDIFTYMGKLLGLDGLMAFPAYYHNAVLFSRYFRFVNPDKWGEVLAIHRSLPQVPLKQLAWIVHWNCLLDHNGRPYEWQAEEQLRPLNRSLRKYFNSRVYQMRVKHTQKKLSFSVDWEAFRRKSTEAGLQLTDR